MEQKQEKLYALLNEKLDHTEEISDEEILVEIDKLIWEEAKGQYMPLSEKITLRQQLFNGIRRLDILQELLEDESVTEIMVNGTDGIFVEREGRIRCWEHRFVSKTKLEDVVQQIAGKCNRIVNEAKEEAARIVKHAQEEALLEKKHAMNDMKQEMITVASLMAQKVVASSITAEIQSTLVDETLKEMGESTWQN